MQLDLIQVLRTSLQQRYAVDQEVGHGGMAVVYRARDLERNQLVAIKVLHPELAVAMGARRFLREIDILARLQHPNILALLDSGMVEAVPELQVPWYVMPFVDDSLRMRLRREGMLPVETALRFTREICGALSVAHGRGYIHRDIKPENILLSNDHALLADFGIARAITVASGDTISTTGLLVGTPAYMSPEQSNSGSILDGRTDLYSLGVVLYEMLAGEPLFTGSTPQAIATRHQLEAPPSIRIVRPDISEAVERFLLKALAKSPTDRIASAGDFISELTLTSV